MGRTDDTGDLAPTVVRPALVSGQQSSSIGNDKTQMNRTDQAAGARPVKRIDIEELLAGAKEVVIVHLGKEYLLRVTSRGRLILTR